MRALPASSTSFDDSVLLLDEPAAVRRAFDAANGLLLGRLLSLFAAVVAVVAISSASRGQLPVTVAAAANVLLCVALRRARTSSAVARHPRPVLAGTLLGQYLLLAVYAGGSTEAVMPWAVMFPFALALVRFDALERHALAAGMIGVTALMPLLGPWLPAGGEAAARPDLLEVLLPHVILVAVAASLGWWLTRRHRRRFLLHWHAERDRHHDRLRMKQELEHAREIQLSMLPRTVPTSDWLDIAALSLPATEVGGDYFDYFALDSDRLVVVLADVAGHGVASGLVLSGVRAGLNMLDGELASPVDTLQRLNRMLVRTSPRTMLVTMAVCLLDRRTRRARLATAGNPPPLHWSAASRRLSELTPGSLPLGVREDVDYRESAVDLQPGDGLLVCSDGIAEATDAGGEPFGYERLATAFADAAERPGAQAVRDELLQSVWAFKGHAPQIDDITMVIVKVR